MESVVEATTSEYWTLVVVMDWSSVLNVNYFVRFATIILSGFLVPKLTDFHAPLHC